MIFYMMRWDEGIKLINNITNEYFYIIFPKWFNSKNENNNKNLYQSTRSALLKLIQENKKEKKNI